MANQGHIEILKQGVEVWNKWREEHPEVRPDFSGSNLSGANIREINLRNTNLSYTDLRRADLRGADLSNAYLVAADLSDAKLTGANFEKAIVGLDPVSIYGTTYFVNVDLSDVKGLETVLYDGPSTIDIDTLVRSKGKIPIEFLRGCGVPEPFITNLYSLFGSIQFFSCFISFSSKNQDFAECLYNDLQSKGVRCWYAPEDLKIGDKFHHRIDESIRLYDKLLVVLSKNSVTSPWVENEVMAALEKENKQPGKTVLFPITVDETVMEVNIPWAASMRRSRHIGDFRKWKSHDDYQKAFERLLRNLKAEE